MAVRDALQIGENYTLFVTQPRQTGTRTGVEDTFRVYLNPLITHFSPQTNLIYEGCGSVLHGQLFGPVIRPQEIAVQAQDQTGKTFTLTCDGLLAHIIQHEYDHLAGIEFTEKIADYSKLMAVDFYRDMMKNTPDLVAAAQITKLDIRYS